MNSLIKTAAILALAFSAQAFAHGHDMDGKFKAMDADHDGKVSAAEHSTGASEMFNNLDADKDGKVTANEMQSAMDNKKVGKKMRGPHVSAADKIKMIDTDGDGALTQQEHADGSAKMFTEMDKDSDGFLTAKEMSAGHDKMMKKATH